MNRKTHYEVLGVDALATSEAIKKAYLVRSKMFHPDRFDPASQSSEWAVANDMLKELNEAYAVLRDPQKRAVYSASLRGAVSTGASAVQKRPAQSPVAPPPPETEKAERKRVVLPLLWLLIFFVVLAVVLVKLNSSFDLLSRVPNLPLLPKAEAPRDLPLPLNGEMQNFSGKKALAPFQIKAPGGRNFVVKMEDASTQKPALTIFVRGGDTALVHVPLGSYIVKYAFGETWYGEKDLFGPMTKYSKAERTLVFKREGDQYTGYFLTLSIPAKGNLKASGIKAEEF